MSRGFDVDDFRDSDSSRDVGRGASSGWDTRNRLAEIHREEERTDQQNQEQRERSDKYRPPLPREDRIQSRFSLQRVRLRKYVDRGQDLLRSAILRFTRFPKSANSALSPRKTLRRQLENLLTTATAPTWRTTLKIWPAKDSCGNLKLFR